MGPKRVSLRNRLARGLLIAVAAGCAGACASGGNPNPFASGKIDPGSPVAGEVESALRSPGPYPSFAHVPPVPTDVRPASAWRASVYEAWGLKTQTEAEAAAIPFVLVQGEAESWAAVERAKIPAAEMTPPAADVSEQTEAFAAAARARATPPPPPK